MADSVAVPGTAHRAHFRRLRSPIQFARRAGLQRTPLHQRITPPAQGRNVDIDPIVPPIDGLRIESKKLPRLEDECDGEKSRVFTFEDMCVVEDKMLVKLEQLLRAA